MKMIAGIAVIAVVFVSQGVEANMVSEMADMFGHMFVDVIVNCTSEHDVSFESVAALMAYKFSFDADIPEPDQSILCAASCVLKKLNVMDENGKLQLGSLTNMIPNEDKRKKVNSDIEDCEKEADSKTDAQHKCSGIHFFGKCMFMKQVQKIKEKICGTVTAA